MIGTPFNYRDQYLGGTGTRILLRPEDYIVIEASHEVFTKTSVVSPSTLTLTAKLPAHLQNYLANIVWKKDGSVVGSGASLSITAPNLYSTDRGYTYTAELSLNVSLTATKYIAVNTQYDSTQPPLLTFTASGGITNIIIETSAPTFLVGGGHAKTILFGKIRNSGDPAPIYTQAVQIGSFQGAVFSFATEPATTWHLWAAWESKDGVLGPVAGGTNGIVVTTGQNVAKLLTALTGQIRESQLFNDLNTRINLIDVPGPGSLPTLASTLATGYYTKVQTDTNIVNVTNAAIATANSNTAAALTNYYTKAAADSAIATSTQTVSSRLDTGDFAVVKQTANTSANTLGTVTANYMLKTQVSAGGQTRIAGFGLYNDASTGSAFGVMADRFYISPPSGNAAGVTGEILPFIVQAAGSTLQDGTVVPAGVYIDSAYIRNGTITNAKIGDATIDNAKIANLSASKLTAGTLQVGTTLQSSNYNGVNGWYIRSVDGYAEFNNIKARGEISADSGTIGGLVIASDRIYNVGKGYDASGTGFHLQSNGELRVGNYYGAFMEFVNGRFLAKSGAGVGPDVSWLDLGATGSDTVLKIKDKLYINADGTSYFSGTLNASGGTIGGLAIASDRIYSVGKGFDASGTGFHLQSNGELRVGNYYGAFIEFVNGRFFAKSGAGVGPDVSWIDLGATGSDSVLKIKDRLSINADGTTYFRGTTVPVGSTAYGSIPAHNLLMTVSGTIFISITANFLASAAGSNTTVWLHVLVNGTTYSLIQISVPGGFSSSGTATCMANVGPGVHTISGTWWWSGGTTMTLGTASTFAIGVQG